MENRLQFYCPCKHSRTLILGSQVKPRWEISAEFEPPLLDSEPWELHAHKSYMENWACKDQSGASRLILHCSHRETKARPWPLPQMLILWGPQEEAESPCLNGGAESLENLISLHQVLQEDMGVELGNTTSF